MDPATIAGIASAGVQFLGGLTGQSQGRLSDERFRENEARADITNTNDIERYKTFLSAITGTQAQEYNKYQDQTFAADTQREIDRITAQGEQLGMSPWELKGQAGASPLPSPAFTGGGATGGQQGTAFMANMVPIEVAKINARTQLGVAAINNATSLQNTNTTQNTGSLAKINKLVGEGQAAYYQAQTDNVNTQNVITALDFIYDKLPEQQFNLAIGSVRSKQGWDKVLNAFRSSDTGGTGSTAGATVWSNTNDAIRSAINSLPKDEQAAFFRDLDSAVRAGAKQAAQSGSEFFSGATNNIQSFLKNLIPK